MKTMWSQIVSPWVDAGLYVIAPSQCHSCKQLLEHQEKWLCKSCLLQLQPAPEPKCTRCSAQVGPNIDTTNGCIYCKQDRFQFERVISYGFYQDKLKEVILRIKHLEGEQLAQTMGSFLGLHISNTLQLKPDLITCIPVHWWKRLIKGHNQTESIAKGVAEVLGVNFGSRILRKVRFTPEQSRLLPTERRKNLRRAFACTNHSLVRCKHILLVDDVLTTGATANNVAKVLVGAGAKSVIVAVLARSFGK